MILEWRSVLDYEGFYEVSEHGHVLSKYGRPKLLTPQLNAKEYLQVKLCKDKLVTMHLVHRLILTAFVGPAPIGTEARHLDGNRQRNKLSNLTWGTHKENVQDMISHSRGNLAGRYGEANPKCKLTNEEIVSIKTEYNGVRGNVSYLASKYGITREYVHRILRGGQQTSATEC